jgi:hypothetical protein
VTFLLNFLVVFMSKTASMITYVELGYVGVTLFQLFLFIQQLRMLGYLKNDYAENDFA